MKTRNLSYQVLFFVFFIVAAVTLSTSHAESPAATHKPEVKIKVLRADRLDGLVDGKETTATMIEITFDPLADGPPHRHPGSVCGYVVEGTLEFQIGNQPLKTLKAGDTFFEPAMILHRVARNPDKEKPTRIVVTMIHPSDAKRLVIPEPSEILNK